MIRLAVEALARRGETAQLTPQDSHYLRVVMRKKPGDAIEVLTRDGTVWLCRLMEAGRVRFDEPLAQNGAPRRRIMLFQALLKGDRFGEVVERGTEAGIVAFIPLVTARTIVRQVSGNKQTRWETIAKEASEQSRAFEVPRIGDLVTIDDIAVPEDHEGYVLDPRAPAQSAWLTSSTKPVALAVGPEGGFTPEEYHKLYAKGFQPISLGPRVYRAENAGAFAAVLFLQDVTPTFGQDC
ncbi:RsmE family RNA methyltransferase [Sulfobacillus harzensis]|uniref:Ribosomal RNA small subunit methyltransferase E n=1 Tax=Sulfobacillus harzensis TaxID=2729629 RepID=A0A7Y0L6V2_9FIRM|nr:RsmE family RNA methyltransferase [Sulfobacillus harzensis]NMP23004.1 16S rRNA (uracil(1498)-N(3))-methyltransferase [Sulfobacillus harzensis]